MSHSDSDTPGRENTHNDVRDLTERLVGEMVRLLVFARSEVDHDDFVGDITFLGDQRDTTRASGKWESVKLDRHEGCREDDSE